MNKSLIFLKYIHIFIYYIISYILEKYSIFFENWKKFRFFHIYRFSFYFIYSCCFIYSQYFILVIIAFIIIQFSIIKFFIIQLFRKIRFFWKWMKKIRFSWKLLIYHLFIFLSISLFCIHFSFYHEFRTKIVKLED